MDRIFAPWRMEFIEGHHKAVDCVLCAIGADKNSSQVIYRGQTMYVVMNKYPYSNGHLMIVPLRHVGKWTELTKEELAENADLTQRSLLALEKALSPEGYNVGTNLGRVAGAGIVDHVHQHIVPRWLGDHNFMPVLAETKVISEHLEVTTQKIKAMWK